MLKDADAGIIDYGDGSTGSIKGADSLRSMLKSMMVQWVAAVPDTKIQKYRCGSQWRHGADLGGNVGHLEGSVDETKAHRQIIQG